MDRAVGTQGGGSSNHDQRKAKKNSALEYGTPRRSLEIECRLAIKIGLRSRSRMLRLIYGQTDGGTGMPLHSTDGRSARISKSEYEELRAKAEAAGQGHWFPPSIEEYGDLLQAHACAEGSRLLDVLFGEEVFGDSSAREAMDRGELTTKDILGVTDEELRELIERKAREDADAHADDRSSKDA